MSILEELPQPDFTRYSNSKLQFKLSLTEKDILYVYMNGLKDEELFWYYRKLLGLIRNELLKRGVMGA